jgi:regulator of cell morphogenesis and NO signaling
MNTMKLSYESIVEEIVKFNFITAPVFFKNNIAFCCDGNLTIHAACYAKGIDEDRLIEQLNAKINITYPAPEYFANLELDELADFIVNQHHSFVKNSVPFLKDIIVKIIDKHGNNHPELHEVQNIFDVSVGEFTMHMQKEELVIFPYIKRLAEINRGSAQFKEPYFGSISNPIKKMLDDHSNEIGRLGKIAELTKNYSVPEDGCTNYSVALQYLQYFEHDLHKHIHLENDILFPQAIEMEAQFIS